MSSLTHHLSMVKFSEKNNQCYKIFARTPLNLRALRVSRLSFCRASKFMYQSNHLNLSKSGFVSKEGHSGCKSQNTAITALKGNILCQIRFKWTYEANLVDWWGSSKNKFAFSDHSFTRLAVARWQDSISRGHKSWIVFNFPHWFFFDNVEIIVNQICFW